MQKLNCRTLTTGEAAAICDVSQQTIIRCFDRGHLKGYRIPGRKDRRIPVEALFAFMTEHNIPTKRFLDSLSAESRAELLESVQQPLKIVAPEDRPNRVAGLFAIADGTG